MAVWKQLYPLSSAMRLWAWHHFLQPQMTSSTLVTASDFLFSMLTADLATVKSYCWKNIEGTQPSQSKSHFQDLSLLRQADFPCSHGNGTDMLKGRAVRKNPQFRIVLTGVWRETVSSFLGDYLLYLHLSRTLTRNVFIQLLHRCLLADQYSSEGGQRRVTTQQQDCYLEDCCSPTSRRPAVCMFLPRPTEKGSTRVALGHANWAAAYIS